MKNKSLFRIVSMLCAVILTVTVTPMTTYANENTVTTENIDQVVSSSAVFLDYRDKYINSAYPDKRVSVFSEDNLSFYLQLGEKDKYTANIAVEEAGMYALEVTYKVSEETSEDTAFSVLLDGSIPYFEASGIGLSKTYKDVYDFEADVYTDDVIANQVVVDEFRTSYCFDTIGYYGSVLYFYLKEGVNEVTLAMVSGSVCFSDVAFVKYEEAPEYTGKLDDGVPVYDGESLYFEAETIDKKSHSSILAVSDNSSAAVSPVSPFEKYLNVVGGANFETIGQFVQWKFNVPESGYYNIAIKYRQEKNVGMNSYRRITIDGSVPYSELEEYAFPYTTTYRNEILSCNDEKMYFYLEKGEHTLGMQVVIGGLSEVLPYINTIAGELTDAYRQIIMITGTTPDTLRDYLLENSIPETLDSLSEQNAKLKELLAVLEDTNKSSSSASKTIGTLIEQLDLFEQDSYYITQNLPSFKSNVSALSNWLLEAKTQPLKIDYLAVFSPKGEICSAKSGFADSVAYNVKSFLYTFSKEYVGGSSAVDGKENISVWVLGNATKYSILDRLISADFEKQNPDISVDLKLVTFNLATSILAGKNPDVALEHNSTEIMNLVYRNSVVCISDFEDYENTISRFRKCSVEPLSYGGKVYALPSTQTYSVMFYRTDIFEELNLSVPETWDDVIYTLSELKKNNLEFGIPHTMEVFSSMLYQNGGQLYNENKTATDLNTQSAVEAFTTFTSLFTDYSAPLSFNAQNRFRTGEMPILIGNIDFYNTLKVLAPEIEGRWDVLPYPSTVTKDGEVSRAQVTIVTGDVILNKDKADACWRFLNWKSSVPVQLELSRNYEMALGRSERLMSANTEAFINLGWHNEMIELISSTENQLVGIPAVPGSYYLNRHINNAIAAVIYKDEIAGDALNKYAKVIDAEIAYKIDWFDLENN